MISRPGVPGRGQYRHELPRPGVPKRVKYSSKLPRPDVPGRGHYRPELPRPCVPGRGHCRPRFPARRPTGWHRRLLILLSNTQRIMWCCFGSPCPIFRSGPLRRLSSAACHILTRSSLSWPKRPGFLTTMVQWSSLCRRPIQAHTNASFEACATLTPLFGQREANCRVIWQLSQCHAESRHETSPFEHWQQTVGRRQPGGPSVGYWSPGG